MMMRVNGLPRKSQLLRKTGMAYDKYEGKWAPQQKWHAPVAHSHAPAPTLPRSRSRGTLPWHALPARARPQSPPAPKPEILMENTFTNALRLKTQR